MARKKTAVVRVLPHAGQIVSPPSPAGYDRGPQTLGEVAYRASLPSERWEELGVSNQDFWERIAWKVAEVSAQDALNFAKTPAGMSAIARFQRIQFER